MGFQLSFFASLLLFLTFVNIVVSQRNPLRYEVVEELPAGTFVGNVATDSGLKAKYPDVFNSLLYRFLRVEPHNQLFAISPNGMLTTSQELDRERICPEEDECIVQLTFAVAPVKYFTTIKVEVLIKDVNDNPPRFQSTSINIKVSEAVPVGSTFRILSAQDADTRPNRIVQYRITSTDQTFALDPSTSPEDEELVLVVKKPLDRETRDRYDVTLVAEDGGQPPLTGSLKINISIADANDHCPTFTQEIYSVTLPEDTLPRSTVVQTKALDQDKGRNAEIRYSFATRTSRTIRKMFEIDRLTGRITLSSELDYDRHQSFRITVEAKDSAVLPCTGKAIVEVKLEDRNDNRPQIDLSFAKLELPYAEVVEDAPNGTFVAHVAVTDKDTGHGGVVHCELLHAPKFRLVPRREQNEYIIQTWGSFDRELRHQYEAMVRCADNGRPSLATEKPFTIRILDRNDKAPEFTASSYYITVEEGNRPGDLITSDVKALDADEHGTPNAELVYSLEGKDAQLFSINPTNGLVTANVALDAEDSQLINLVVRATDNGDPPLSATSRIIISIADVNDNVPEFSKASYKFHVTEDRPPGTVVGYIHATDRDVTTKGQPVALHLDLNQPDHAFFEFKEFTGQLVTRSRLDRETKKEYHLVVVGTDRGHSPRANTAPIRVIVDDINDNGPQVEFPTDFNNTVYISYLAGPGSHVTKILAFDPDAGINGTLNYTFFQGNENALFSLNPNTGEVTTAKQLASGHKGVYDLVIIISDRGIPRNTARSKLVKLIVAVTDPALGSYPPFSGPRGRGGPGNPDSGGDDQQNLIIVVVLVAVSAVVAVTIILILVCLRRREYNTHSYNASQQEFRKEQMHNVEIVMDCETIKDTKLSHQNDMNRGLHGCAGGGTLNRESDGSSAGGHSASSALLPGMQPKDVDGMPISATLDHRQPEIVTSSLGRFNSLDRRTIHSQQPQYHTDTTPRIWMPADPDSQQRMTYALRETDVLANIPVTDAYGKPQNNNPANNSGTYYGHQQLRTFGNGYRTPTLPSPHSNNPAGPTHRVPANVQNLQAQNDNSQQQQQEGNPGSAAAACDSQELQTACARSNGSGDSGIADGPGSAGQSGPSSGTGVVVRSAGARGSPPTDMSNVQNVNRIKDSVV